MKKLTLMKRSIVLLLTAISGLNLSHAGIYAPEINSVIDRQVNLVNRSVPVLNAQTLYAAAVEEYLFVSKRLTQELVDDVTIPPLQYLEDNAANRDWVRVAYLQAAYKINLDRLNLAREEIERINRKISRILVPALPPTDPLVRQAEYLGEHYLYQIRALELRYQNLLASIPAEIESVELRRTIDYFEVEIKQKLEQKSDLEFIADLIRIRDTLEALYTKTRDALFVNGSLDEALVFQKAYDSVLQATVQLMKPKIGKSFSRQNGYTYYIEGRGVYLQKLIKGEIRNWKESRGLPLDEETSVIKPSARYKFLTGLKAAPSGSKQKDFEFTPKEKQSEQACRERDVIRENKSYTEKVPKEPSREKVIVEQKSKDGKGKDIFQDRPEGKPGREEILQDTHVYSMADYELRRVKPYQELPPVRVPKVRPKRDQPHETMPVPEAPVEPPEINETRQAEKDAPVFEPKPVRQTKNLEDLLQRVREREGRRQADCPPGSPGAGSTQTNDDLQELKRLQEEVSRLGDISKQLNDLGEKAQAEANKKHQEAKADFNRIVNANNPFQSNGPGNGPGPRDVAEIKGRLAQITKELVQFALPIAMGTPYDVAELGSTVFLGFDLLGNPTTNLDIALAAVAVSLDVIVPVGSKSPMIKGIAKAVKHGALKPKNARLLAKVLVHRPSLVAKALGNPNALKVIDDLSDIGRENFDDLAKKVPELTDQALGIAPGRVNSLAESGKKGKPLSGDESQKFLNEHHDGVYTEPVFDPNVGAFKHSLKPGDKFVRVGDGTNGPGNFVVPEDVIRGKTPNETKDLLALPKAPTHFSRVTVNESVEALEGPIARNNFGSGEGGWQVAFTEKGRDLAKSNKVSFTDPEPIGEFFK